MAEAGKIGADGLGDRARLLAVQPGDIIIATKWRPVFRTARSILNTIEERLEILGNYPIDLYRIHKPLSFSSIEKQIKTIALLVKTNKVRYIGVSNFSAKQMKISHSLGSGKIDSSLRF